LPKKLDEVTKTRFEVAAHAPPEQPPAHGVSVGTYEHEPPEHVPGDAYVRRDVADVHAGGGGELHAIGVPAQVPLAHVSPVVHASPSSQEAPSA
jgi:hypothetical protein